MMQKQQQTSTEPPALLVIDEYAALFNTTKEKNIINNKISYISSIGRAANCFLILTTQHPTNSNINNTIRSNLQSRAALKCETIQQSKNIINTTEATQIKQIGSYLFKTESSPQIEKIKACFITNEFLLKVLNKS